MATRIPDNWYKRAIGNEYTIPGFLADVVDFGEKYPPLLSTGGNTGKPGKCFLFKNVSELLRGSELRVILVQGMK